MVGNITITAEYLCEAGGPYVLHEQHICHVALLVGMASRVSLVEMVKIITGEYGHFDAVELGDELGSLYFRTYWRGLSEAQDDVIERVVVVLCSHV